MKQNKRDLMYQYIKEHGDNLKSIFDIDMDSIELYKILSKISSLLNCDKDIMFLNGDARGYALKFTNEFSKDKDIHKDWGGYGIIAPDYSNISWPY